MEHFGIPQAPADILRFCNMVNYIDFETKYRRKEIKKKVNVVIPTKKTFKKKLNIMRATVLNVGIPT